MKIALSRGARVPIREQLVKQLELRILAGDIAPGGRLPSVRTMARRLGVHANTVSAAYRDLQRTGHVLLRKGVGLFVRRDYPPVSASDGVDTLVRRALAAVEGRGLERGLVRNAVERWLRGHQPARVAVLDPNRDTAELMACEVRGTLGVSAVAVPFDQLRAGGPLSDGVLAVVLPYHLERLSFLAPELPVEVAHIHVADEDRQAVLSLPEGALVLIVSHAQSVLVFSTVLFQGLRGESVLIEGRLLEPSVEWRRLVPAADLVFADALSIDAVRRCRPQRARDFQLLSKQTLERIRIAVSSGPIPPTTKSGPARSRIEPAGGAMPKRPHRRRRSL